MNKTKLYIVISAMAIYHNNQRYEQGDKLELTDEEAQRISLYVQLDETKQTVTEADIQAAEANIAKVEAETKTETKTKGKKGE
ncbi:hypothetical protein GVX76_00785 [[Haemophilus] felis]|nr:hypothetical protein [[Haemophilus] felis]